MASARAVERFTTSGLDKETLAGSDDDSNFDRRVLTAEWGTAVFEALNWSVTLDERLRHELDGSDWTSDIEEGVRLLVGVGEPSTTGAAPRALAYMFELQKEFSVGYLLQFLTEARVPLVHVRNQKPQQEDLPDELHIYASADEAPDDLELIQLDDLSDRPVDWLSME